jgi:GH24 family phage-related lysozyme (muramidase)
MKTSDKGIEQIKSFEGFRAMPYDDVVGKLTVGYGHLIVPGDGCVAGSPITMGQATELLRKDLHTAEEAVNSCGVELTQNEFDALVSFTYNLGTGAFQRSTLLKLLKTGNKVAASGEFPKWSMAGGKEVPGILKRRHAEQDCFLHATYVG